MMTQATIRTMSTRLPRAAEASRRFEVFLRTRTVGHVPRIPTEIRGPEHDYGDRWRTEPLLSDGEYRLEDVCEEVRHRTHFA
jgi:hypothetical protein